jgi:phosphoenolpyruvate carboxykinase (GTP)
MADYFGHWIDIGRNPESKKLPKIFNVNWFRTNKEGEFLWPGFGENSRVLKWIFERIDSQDSNSVETPIGYVPDLNNFDISDLEGVNQETLTQLFNVDKKEWNNEVDTVSTYFNKTFGRRLPKEIRNQVEMLKNRLKNK